MYPSFLPSPTRRRHCTCTNVQMKRNKPEESMGPAFALQHKATWSTVSDLSSFLSHIRNSVALSCDARSNHLRQVLRRDQESERHARGDRQRGLLALQRGPRLELAALPPSRLPCWLRCPRSLCTHTSCFRLALFGSLPPASVPYRPDQSIGSSIMMRTPIWPLWRLVIRAFERLGATSKAVNASTGSAEAWNMERAYVRGRLAD